MTVKVDHELCCGCGQCEEIRPGVFQIDGTVARVIVDVAPPETEAACRHALEHCPTGAISIEE